MFEYKGLYYDCSNENHFYEGGAHFKYYELYARLEMLAYEINEKIKDNNNSVNNEDCINQNEISKNNNNIIKDNLIEKEKKLNEIEKKEEPFNNDNKIIFVKTKKNSRPRNVSLNIKNHINNNKKTEKSKIERAMEYSIKLRHINSFSKLNKNFTINIQNKNKLKRNRCNSDIDIIKTQKNNKIIDINNINIKNNFNITETINNSKNLINNNINIINVKKNNISNNNNNNNNNKNLNNIKIINKSRNKKSNTIKTLN